MKLLKVDHYSVTRLLVEGSDGTTQEILVDSLGNHDETPWEGSPDGSIEGLSWDEYSRSDFASVAFFRPEAHRL